MKGKWIITGLIPLILLIGVLGWVLMNGAGVEKDPAAPIEVLNIERIKITETGFQLSVSNTGPKPLTISQVMVNDSVWNFSISPQAKLERFEEGMVTIAYPWVEGDPHAIKLITENGIITEGEVAAATLTPETTWSNFLNYGIIGFYVGIVPITLGLLWYPFMKRFSRKWINAILALTVGLLLFLFVGTLADGFEIGAEAPSVFQGNMVVIIGASLTFLLLIGFDQYQQRKQKKKGYSPLGLALLMATGIGLHNFGEGLAIGSSFSLGEAALGTFLIIGFTLHNITEGIGIAAPLLKTTPRFRDFLLLGVIAGAPAIAGTWVGGFIFSPIWGALFLGIGAGAILQVIYVISKMLIEDHRTHNEASVSWLNLSGFSIGLLIMYFTAFFVKF
ncbi:ZIP family metal transporter [Peribacillus simplex]|uniref:ZIP family metal transporter n=2 Tax=Peribacillus simplex TaxID=1478 RepID=A0A223ECD7_9BACI|nr:ZIP family metal transporter [Peribacillus simplex]ASS92906.1 ZIP family metal transporter [Peribacillus simplex NBRC 15720 = DSM 1321]MEC1398106.1 ZIP family metal transporter [Peribacillus simplex]MED3986208.1 ZIP family metal transporter [Peribacillus simplex]MED4097486.1 ZIP family metal transporter [Peribacillus simplex]TVX84232.1 ZIP family metal transporter [Peribacillus simplex]